MKREVLSLIPAATLLLLAGCWVTTTALAPGAADVQIDRSATAVSSCTAVGNVRQSPDLTADMRNLTVGVGGNTLFVTEESSGFVKAGVAYRCPK
jgi:hypothetical protein